MLTLSWWLLLACTGDDKVPDDQETDETDVSAHSDTEDTEPACPDVSLTDVTIPVVEGCVKPPFSSSWALVARPVASGGGSAHAVHVGRVGDTNGDGRVDGGDAAALWLQDMDGSTGLFGETLFDPEGLELAATPRDALWSWSTLADVDGLPGAELVVVDADAISARLRAFSGSAELWSRRIDARSYHRPWVTDLEGDGQAEVLVGPYRFAASDGRLLLQLTALDAANSYSSVAADLDLDGDREQLITWKRPSGERELAWFDAAGEHVATCFQGGDPDGEKALIAVGDLDGDSEGEVVAGGPGYLVTCDADGALLHSKVIGLFQASQVGIGQLDLDPEPEIIAADYGQLRVFEHDLSEKWAWAAPDPGRFWDPFALADLDGDGIHEIVTRHVDLLTVLDGGGGILATLLLPSGGGFSGGAPAVIDLDGDGMSEVVVDLSETFAVVHQGTGGWNVVGGDDAWPGTGKHPGDRSPSGGLPAVSAVHWADPATNVWEGLPTGAGPPEAVDLTVAVVDACVDGGGAHLVVQVGNEGARDLGGRVELLVRRQEDDAELFVIGLEGGIRAGVGRPVGVHVRDPANLPIELVVDAAGLIGECDELDNSVAWSP